MWRVQYIQRQLFHDNFAKTNHLECQILVERVVSRAPYVHQQLPLAGPKCSLSKRVVRRFNAVVCVHERTSKNTVNVSSMPRFRRGRGLPCHKHNLTILTPIGPRRQQLDNSEQNTCGTPLRSSLPKWAASLRDARENLRGALDLPARSLGALDNWVWSPPRQYIRKAQEPTTTIFMGRIYQGGR